MKKRSKLVIGGFYLIYGGTPHPSLVFKYDPKHKTYLAIKFGTTKTRHMTKIHPIQKGENSQYVHNRPIEGTIDDFGKKELLGLSIDGHDLLTLDLIKMRVPIKTNQAKKRYKK